MFWVTAINIFNYILKLPQKSFFYPNSSLLKVKGAPHLFNYQAIKGDQYEESNHSRFFCPVRAKF
jgi:hypothetical protein